ncbi:MAG: selenium cofactor biosynthesis protein YqeC [Haloferacaceae archaeon]
MDIVDALEATAGTTCFVGAGGKKTTMATLAGRIDRAAVTATVRIPIFDSWVDHVAVTDDPAPAVASADAWPVGVVPERERADRYRGYDTATVDALADADVAGAILVKADGARMRLFKAPNEREPQLPGTETVVPVASAHVVGRSLTDEHVHRVDRVAALTGREPGATLRPVDVGTVLASEEGGLKDVPTDATAIPLVNMVDDADLEATAREIAAEIHGRADVPRVVLAEMRADDPLIGIVER